MEWRRFIAWQLLIFGGAWTLLAAWWVQHSMRWQMLLERLQERLMDVGLLADHWGLVPLVPGMIALILGIVFLLNAGEPRPVSESVR